MPKTILMMAGGTGGHVIPALSVAQALAEKGYSIHWLGTQKGIESQLVPAANIPLHHLNIAGLRGKGLLGLLAAPWRISKAIGQALAVMAKVKPCAAVGFGGFATGPGGVAAKLKGIPLFVHEQNAIAGLTNKLLRPLSRVTMQAFPNALANAITVGNPVRPELVSLVAPEKRIQQDSLQPLKVLVVGGSLGAVALNNVVLEALSLIENSERPQVRHQVGKQNLEAMQQAYQEQEVDAEVVPFIADMAEAYGWADWVICRAGALTVSEIAAAGCAALFVPFPYAVDDHQTANANYLVTQGAGELCQQADLTAAFLAEKIQQYSKSRQALVAMAQTAKNLAITTATTEVVKHIEEVCCGER